MTRILLAAALALPTAAFAVGGDSSLPPTPTETTETCTDGQIWSPEAGACVDAQESRLDDDTLYGAAREFAYAGQYDHALTALAAMSTPMDDRVLTYKGFTHRRMGDVALGMAYYRQALEQNPDNLLARSYMGMGLVEDGQPAAARAQLTEIRARGGRGTWAEVALRLAIQGGPSAAY